MHQCATPIISYRTAHLSLIKKPKLKPYLLSGMVCLFVCLFVCNRGDTLMCQDGLRTRKLGQSPMCLVFYYSDFRYWKCFLLSLDKSLVLSNCSSNLKHKNAKLLSVSCFENERNCANCEKWYQYQGITSYVQLFGSF